MVDFCLPQILAEQRRKEGTISAFNQSFFDTPTIVPTTEVKCKIG
jgi:hypothetical protein